MILALCTGSLAKDPEIRTSKAGNPYVQVKVRCGGSGRVQYVRVAAFTASIQDEFKLRPN